MQSSINDSKIYLANNEQGASGKRTMQTACHCLYQNKPSMTSVKICHASGVY
jgi:hypothetical protein